MRRFCPAPSLGAYAGDYPDNYYTASACGSTYGGAYDGAYGSIYDGACGGAYGKIKWYYQLHKFRCV